MDIIQGSPHTVPAWARGRSFEESMIGGVNHELARQLKDAGFPNIADVQHRQGREFIAPDGTVSVYSLGEVAPTEDWFIPTLVELIEACGAGFHDLRRLDDGKWWTANGEGGPTPSEAVSRLWLALNKK